MNIIKVTMLSLIFLFLLVILVCIIIGISKKLSYSNAIERSIKYLYNHTQESGRFVYMINSDKSVKINSKKYNNLRHAGTLYAMYLCERYLKNNTLKQKRLLASQYYIERYIKPYKDGMYAVVSIGEEEDLPDDNWVKLGAQGLALASLSNLYPEGKVDLEILKGLGKFIVFMQNENGSFNSKYNMKSENLSDFNSLYYPGEAVLGLLYLYEVDSDELWLNTAKKALLYLAESRKDLGNNVPFDHWITIATKKLFETNKVTEDEKRILQRHCEQIAYAMLDNQVIDSKNPYNGVFKDNLNSASLGTKMEGLSAAYYCTDDKKLKKLIKKSLNAGTKVLIENQIKDGDLIGGLPNKIYWKISENQKDKTIRIDNVQHVLSCWINYVTMK